MLATCPQIKSLDVSYCPGSKPHNTSASKSKLAPNATILESDSLDEEYFLSRIEILKATHC